MARLRLIAPALALLLAILVGGEVTDVLPCLDEECGAWSALLYPDAPPVTDGSGVGEACLCHASFVPMAVGLIATAPPEDPAMGAPPWAPLRGPTARVPVPPPRS